MNERVGSTAALVNIIGSPNPYHLDSRVIDLIRIICFSIMGNRRFGRCDRSAEPESDGVFIGYRTFDTVAACRRVWHASCKNRRGCS